jgi:hypothetical protein
MIEAYGAFARRLRENTLVALGYHAVIADFTAVCLRQCELMELTVDVIEKARQLLERHPSSCCPSVSSPSDVRVVVGEANHYIGCNHVVPFACSGHGV